MKDLIKPLEAKIVINTTPKYTGFDLSAVRDLEQNYREAIQASRLFIKAYEGAMKDNHWSKDTGEIMKSMIEIYLLRPIEKAYGKSWAELREK